jgi:hypothetical protein
MVNVAFNAAIGTKFLLEVENVEKRFYSIFVGYAKDDFVLVTTPLTDNLFSMRPALFMNYRITVRYIADGKAVGFQTKLIKSSEEPARLLFLSYPEKIEDYELRTEKRAPCTLPAEVKIQEVVYNALIVDINQTGLRLHIRDSAEFSSHLTANTLGQECGLRFFLPGDGSVPKEVSGEIRNYQHNNGHIAVGIKFTNISEQDKQNIVEFESKLFV